MKWACPECGAPAHGHGKGGKAACADAHGVRASSGCEGLICECDNALGDHDETNPCLAATCYHCGWGGTFPVPAFDPKRLTGWAKTAHAAGWRPPAGWTPAK